MSGTTPFLSALILSAALSAGAAYAQSATENATDAPGSDLSLGEEDTGPKIGETYVSETSGRWSIRCVKTESGEDPCQMYQLLSDADGVPIAEFSLFRLPDGGEAVAGATVIVPLETSLQQQLGVTVDEQPGKRYPFAMCNPVGCYSRIGLTEGDVAQYKRGAEAVLSIVPFAAQDQRINVSLSLEGFTAAYENETILRVR